MDYSLNTINEWTRLGMRKSFGKQMIDIAKDNPNIIVLTADVANSANLESFKEKFPQQFYNIGIAEQNMTGIACGLAKEGCNVFITSFTPFVTMRNYEAIRTLVGYMHLNVKIIGLAAGLSLGVQGNTHFCLEDISLMNTIPGMMVLSPADVVEEAKCLEFLAKYEGPAYLRLTGIDGNPCVYKNAEDVEIENIKCIREGERVAILGTGSILSECVRASRALKKDSVDCAVYDICNIKPINETSLREILAKYTYIFTVEEHHCIGGLGSQIVNLCNDSGIKTKILKIGIEDVFPKSGDYSKLLTEYGFTANVLKEKIISALNN